MTLYTLITFLAFVLWVESYNLRINLRNLKKRILRTWGRADWVYPVVRETREWMRTNTIQTYK
jgi:hypothetical protein